MNVPFFSLPPSPSLHFHPPLLRSGSCLWTFSVPLGPEIKLLLVVKRLLDVNSTLIK